VTSAPGVLASYRLYAGYRVRVLLSTGLFGALAVTVAVREVLGRSGPPAWFTAIWICGACWTAYWLLLRLSYRLELTEDSLKWRTPIRSGSVPLYELVSIRPQTWGSNVLRFKLRAGPPLLIMTRKGSAPFADAVQRAAPGVDVRLGWQAAFSERRPWGRSGFHRS
jgi:hypothetical protein